MMMEDGNPGMNPELFSPMNPELLPEMDPEPMFSMDQGMFMMPEQEMFSAPQGMPEQGMFSAPQGMPEQGMFSAPQGMPEQQAFPYQQMIPLRQAPMAPQGMPAQQSQSRAALMKQINEASFAMDDALLFLDTHPNDAQALRYYKNAVNMRRNAMAAFESQFGPLLADNVTGNTWSWLTEKWPWEGGY